MNSDNTELAASVRRRIRLTWLLVIVFTCMLVILKSLGFLNFTSSSVVEVVAPISGTLVALSLAAAQFAQSELNRLYANAQKMIKDDAKFSSVFEFMAGGFQLLRKNLDALKSAIYFSATSLLAGLLGFIGFDKQYAACSLSIEASVVIASFSLTSLVAAVIWIVIVVRASFDYRDVQDIMGHIKQMSVAEDATRNAPVKEAENPDPTAAAPEEGTRA